MIPLRPLAVLLLGAALLTGCSEDVPAPAPSRSASPSPAPSSSSTPAPSPSASLVAVNADIFTCNLIVRIGEAVTTRDGLQVQRLVTQMRAALPKVQDPALRQATRRFLQAYDAQDERAFTASASEVIGACSRLAEAP